MNRRGIEWLDRNTNRLYPLVKKPLDANYSNAYIVDARLQGHKPISSVVVKEITCSSSVDITIDIDGVLYSASFVPYENPKYYIAFFNSTDLTGYIIAGALPDVTIIVNTTVHPITFIDCYDRAVNSVYGDNDQFAEDLVPVPASELKKQLSGDVNLVGGYSISIVITDNIVNFTMSQGFGDKPGQPCGEYANIDGCADAVLNINGVSPGLDGNLRISAGYGMSVESAPEEHKVILKSLLDNTKPGCI